MEKNVFRRPPQIGGVSGGVLRLTFVFKKKCIKIEKHVSIFGDSSGTREGKGRLWPACGRSYHSKDFENFLLFSEVEIIGSVYFTHFVIVNFMGIFLLFLAYSLGTFRKVKISALNFDPWGSWCAEIIIQAIQSNRDGL